MPLAHLRTDVGPWRGDATLAAIDASLASEGSLPLDLPWERFELQRDGDHFTASGVDAFAEALAPTLRAACGGGVTRVHVVSDSTLRGKSAPRVLTRALKRQGFAHVTVDAVCGSGFVGRAEDGEHFYARVGRWLRGREGQPHPPTVLVLMGGWNDARDGRAHLAVGAARACAAMARRRL
jgi:hypothetical protein